MNAAATITNKVMLIISSSAPASELRQEIKQMLREELAEIERRIAAERNNNFDA
jgi:hypothetical protein